MIEILKSVVLPRRPPKNREISLFEGGDCGACCLAGLLGLSDAADGYKLHVAGEYYGGTPIPQIHSFTRTSMQRTLESLTSDTGVRGGREHIPVLLDHVITEVPIWPFGYARHELAFGMRSQFEWRGYVRALLNGGYYGIAQVQHGGYADDTPVKSYGLTDHWIMICGWRYLYVPETDPERLKIGAMGSYREEFLIGDSAKGRPLEEWIEANTFQFRWGGFAALWARPTTL